MMRKVKAVHDAAALRERMVGDGPFVMTSEAEIAQAIRDFQAGRFGAP